MRVDKKVIFSNQNKSKKDFSSELISIKPSSIFCMSMMKTLDRDILSYVCPPIITRYRSDGAIPNETRPGDGNAGIDRQVFFS